MKFQLSVIAALSILLFLSACHKATEQEKVKKVIADIQKAAEEKGIRTVLGHLSKTYHDPQGYDYDGIKGLLAYYFFRHEKVSVYIPSIEATVSGASAKAAFQAVLTGRGSSESAGNILPEALGMYFFDVSLAKESGEWKVTSAKWERSGQGP